ncbi:hypothetical protein PFLUV_G00153800 [Perca fluviatilis]|uniref:Uncharacterized protein n=1 Tax=Perca fluviatilis TaxID=8168 RepID=A0A6A5F0D5_PERFL|nr:hypothetical protein PFLUV_G00153800 [Perca fluviatilis]
MVEIEEARTREVIICPDSAAALETLRVGKSKARPDTVSNTLSSVYTAGIIEQEEEDTRKLRSYIQCCTNVLTVKHPGAEAVCSHVASSLDGVGYHLEWFIRGTPKPREEKSILELREDRKLQEQEGMDSTQVLSLKEKLEFTPRAALNRNRPEKS